MPEPYNWEDHEPLVEGDLAVALKASWNGSGWELTLPPVSDDLLRMMVGAEAANHLICERDEAYEILRRLPQHQPEGGP